MDWLVNSIKDFCCKQGFNHTYWVGYSGGLDSHVLLHLLSSLRSTYPLKLCAVHVNHRLSPHADQWAQHCQSICDALQVDFSLQAVDASAFNGSPEAFARQLRYQVFSTLLGQQDILVTSHHQDDQAETVLLQMLRGAGPKGLAAMPFVKSFSQGFHARPLLNVMRSDLKRYAEKNQLKWIEDESNSDVNFSRNFLRHEIFPLLKKRWPSVASTLSRVAENCANTQSMLDEIISDDLLATSGSRPQTLSVKKLLLLDGIRQRHVLRSWFVQHHVPVPSSIKLQQIQRDMLTARKDKMPFFSWNEVELRRYRDDLFVFQKFKKQNTAAIYEWDLSKPLLLDVGTLSAVLSEGQGLRPDIENITVRFRQGGEKIQLPGRVQHHDLKKLFQEWGVPPWERERIPLIYSNNKLAAVVGFAVGGEFLVKEGEEGWVVSFNYLL